MKLRAALPLAILCSCFACDPEIQPEPAFHITYELPQELSSPVRIVSLGGLSIMATNPATDKSPILLCVNEFGEIQWSKKLSIAAENGLVIISLNKVDDNTFLATGNLGTGYPIIIKFDIDGNIISSKKYSGASEPLDLYKCTTNSAGAIVCNGTLYLNNQTNGFAFKEDKSGNIALGVRTPGIFMSDALTNESGTNSFLFPSFGIPTAGQSVIKLDGNGTLVKSSQLINSADLFLEKVVTVGDDFYLVYTDWGTAMTYVVKINSEAQFVKAIKFADSENPDIDVHHSRIFLSISILGNLNVLELDPDLTIANRKTVVNLVGGDNSTLFGHVEATDDAISCILEPFSIDPTYGNKGLNDIRFQLADWKTKCPITQSNLTTSTTSFQNNAGTSAVETLSIAKEDITVQVQDVVLGQTSICK